MHPHNRFPGRYDYVKLLSIEPGLRSFLTGEGEQQTLDFSNNEALFLLNRALLKESPLIVDWHLPSGFLCPGIPGREDYLRHLADLIQADESKVVRVFDLGTGANLVYPLLGTALFSWSFVGTECNPVSWYVARHNRREQPLLKKRIELRLQPHPDQMLHGTVKESEFFDALMCNPPFYTSLDSADLATRKRAIKSNPKLKSNGMEAIQRPMQGCLSELVFPGGEQQFIRKLVLESMEFQRQFGWFTTLVSRKTTLSTLLPILQSLENCEIRIIPMQHGNKIRRILAWRFS